MKSTYLTKGTAGCLAIFLAVFIGAGRAEAQDTFVMNVTNLYTDTFGPSGTFENITPIDGSFSENVTFDLNSPATALSGPTTTEFTGAEGGYPVANFYETVDGMSTSVAFTGTPEDTLVLNQEGLTSPGGLAVTQASFVVNVFKDVNAADSSDLLRDGSYLDVSAYKNETIGNTYYSLNYDFQLDEYNLDNPSLVALLDGPSTQGSIDQLLTILGSSSGYFTEEGITAQLDSNDEIIQGTQEGFDVKGSVGIEAAPEPPIFAMMLGGVVILTACTMPRFRRA